MEEKNIIFVYPLSSSAKKLKERFEQEGGYNFFEIDNPGEFKQVADMYDSSLTITSDPGKLLRIFSQNKHLAKNSQIKILLISGKEISPKDTKKLNNFGINDILFEPVQEKGLNYKVDLILKNLFRPKETFEEKDLELEKKNSGFWSGKITNQEYNQSKGLFDGPLKGEINNQSSAPLQLFERSIHDHTQDGLNLDLQQGVLKGSTGRGRFQLVPRQMKRKHGLVLQPGRLGGEIQGSDSINTSPLQGEGQESDSFSPYQGESRSEEIQSAYTGNIINQPDPMGDLKGQTQGIWKDQSPSSTSGQVHALDDPSSPSSGGGISQDLSGEVQGTLRSVRWEGDLASGESSSGPLTGFGIHSGVQGDLSGIGLGEGIEGNMRGETSTPAQEFGNLQGQGNFSSPQTSPLLKGPISPQLPGLDEEDWSDFGQDQDYFDEVEENILNYNEFRKKRTTLSPMTAAKDDTPLLPELMLTPDFMGLDTPLKMLNLLFKDFSKEETRECFEHELFSQFQAKAGFYFKKDESVYTADDEDLKAFYLSQTLQPALEDQVARWKDITLPTWESIPQDEAIQPSPKIWEWGIFPYYFHGKNLGFCVLLVAWNRDNPLLKERQKHKIEIMAQGPKMLFIQWAREKGVLHLVEKEKASLWKRIKRGVKKLIRKVLNKNPGEKA